MTKDNFESIIEHAWQKREEDISIAKEAVLQVMNQLDIGKIKVAEKIEQTWVVNQWVKKAIILSFKLNISSPIKHEPFNYFDKLELKFTSWNEQDFLEKQIRIVPGSVVRKSAYIGKSVILMPCFINVGANIGEGSMIDTWVTVGSCAQIGKNCHISGGVGIGGVLEPLQANPVIIEDNCFIGARSEIAEGVIIGEGSVLSMGVFLAQSTKIYNRVTKEITYGYIPPYSVVIPGSLPSEDGSHSLYAAIIVKQVDSNTRKKTSINQLLRS